MARRDRRRGGAHSAPRKGRRSTDLPSAPANPRSTPAGRGNPPRMPYRRHPQPCHSTDRRFRRPVPPRRSRPTRPPRLGASELGRSSTPSGIRPASRSSVRPGRPPPSGATASDLLPPEPDRGDLSSRKERRAAATTGASAGRHGMGPAGGGKGKRKRSWLDRVLIGGIVVVVLALVAVGSGYAYVTYRFNQVAKVTVRHLKTAPVGQPFNVLLIGSDSRRRGELVGRRPLRRPGERRGPAERRGEDRPRGSGHRPGQRALHPP